MSYQVLARKWRPRDFASLVGQEHVVRALTNALSQQRLHHAYLFTGTRGVGKTTLARILAKSFNCETGITATPCGKCSACTEIDAGRFVDLLEVDAATNTKVEEMRQLLENAVYSPTRGRFKVYVIDEVHMLSTSAFNAMLKTLEEPPDHIKFILATTDPQKIPVTVLSRCLQFNLKQMPPASISGHLSKVLELEGIKAEEGALKLISASARGSMRDALSLLDQAIAYSGGDLGESGVRAMLGTVDDAFIFEILDALAAGDAQSMLDIATRMDSLSISFDGAMQDLASMLHAIALAQTAPGSIPDTDVRREKILELSRIFDAEDLQLFYEVAIHGRQELPLAPDAYAGFTMALLRMIAFRPEQPGMADKPRSTVRSAATPEPRVSAPADLSDWPAMVRGLKLGGVVKQLAQQSAMISFVDDLLVLKITPASKHLAEKAYQDKLCAAVSEQLGKKVRLKLEIGDTAGASVQDRAIASISEDALVRGLVEQFDATIVESSIKPAK
jgi:DNA polymerase-3 subunit gamma/tau